MTVYASPVDTAAYGDYRIARSPDDPRPLYRFDGGLEPEASRYHLYAGWFCPWAQRTTLVVALAGLEDAVSVSYVDGARDSRGWAFRETHGSDPVNGFSLLRQAYDATEPGFDGHVSVPTLWDRSTSRVVSNTYGSLDAQLATVFQAHSTTGVELYPADLAPSVDDWEARLHGPVNQGATRAAGQGPEAEQARTTLLETFRELDEHLSRNRFLVGDVLTLADVRLWVTLVRYDVQANAHGVAGPALQEFPALWAYARELYQHPAFRATTDLSTFTAAGARVPDWEQPVRRALDAVR